MRSSCGILLRGPFGLKIEHIGLCGFRAVFNQHIHALLMITFENDIGIYAQDSFFKIEDEACCDVNCGHESMSAAIVSGCNTSPVFQLCKHVFDQMALFIQMPIVRRL